MNQIHTIVITGGPCAGKTTAMSWLQNALTDSGYAVMFIPETCTELNNSGVTARASRTNFDFQRVQVRYQMLREQIYHQAAEASASQEVVVVCDRGSMIPSILPCRKQLLAVWEAKKILLFQADACYNINVRICADCNASHQSTRLGRRIRKRREERTMAEQHPCRSCFLTLSENQRVCPNCGTANPYYNPAAKRVAAANQSKVRSAAGSHHREATPGKCEYCDSVIYSDDKVCPYCGAPNPNFVVHADEKDTVTRSNAEREHGTENASTGKCPYCGATVRSNERYCRSCGSENPHFIEDTARVIIP